MSHLIPARSRIGLIAEGDPDLRVIADWLSRLLRPDLRLLAEDRRRLAPKPVLIRQAPAIAAALLDSGCAHVVVVWDSAHYGSVRATPEQDIAQFWIECDILDRQRRTERLPPIERDKLCPVVSIQELESWLLADERALSSYLSRPTHKVKVKRVALPEREQNPKKILKSLFEKDGLRAAYIDYVDAAPLAARVPDLNRLRRLGSFRSLMHNVDVI